MGILSSIFGNKNHVGKIIDGVASGVDKMAFTDEERVDYHFKFLKLYEPYKVTQRVLVLIFVPPYVLAWFITFIMSIYTDVNTQIDLLHGEVAQIVFLIAGFYFGGGAIEGIVQRFRQPKMEEK